MKLNLKENPNRTKSQVTAAGVNLIKKFQLYFEKLHVASHSNQSECTI